MGSVSAGTMILAIARAAVAPGRARPPASASGSPATPDQLSARCLCSIRI